MPETNTSRLNLVKPSIGGSNNTWGGFLNTDLDNLDRIYRDLTGNLTSTQDPVLGVNWHLVTPVYAGYEDQTTTAGRGFRLLIRSGAAVTGSMHLNNDPVKKWVNGVLGDLELGDFPSGYIGDFAYRQQNSDWILLNPGTGLAADVPFASEATAGKAELATNAEANSETDDTRIITSKKLKYYLDNHTATNAQALAGTDAEILITPASLDHVLDNRVPAATMTASGIIEIATEAEGLTGTDNARAITPSVADYLSRQRQVRTQNQIAECSSLIVSYVSANVVNVDCLFMILYDVNSNSLRRVSSVNVSANITTTGAGGRDAGADASSTWYSIWVIGKDDGTLDALLSQSNGARGPEASSPGAPTMPTGYTWRGYAGSVYNNSSGNFVPFHQCGNSVAIASQGGSALSLADVNWHVIPSITTMIPPEALSVDLRVDMMSSLYEACDCRLASAATAGTPGSGVTFGDTRISGASIPLSPSGGPPAVVSGTATVRLSEAQTVYARLPTATAGAMDYANVYVTGYTI
jgi:hypothetical protein